ncbi:MAG: outer membrane beta-barrel family protein [Terricaulis sp.]|nr:outer membrane beta-barrel family protein [Terricaulis sp.]
MKTARQKPIFSYWSLGLRASHQPPGRRKSSLAYDHTTGDINLAQTVWRADLAGPVSTQLQHNESTYHINRLSFDFQQDGDTDGEALKINILLGRYENDADRLIELTPATAAPEDNFLYTAAFASTTATIKADYEHPLSEGRLLTLGGSFENNDQSQLTRLNVFSGAGADSIASISWQRQTAAIYGTYQFTIDAWTWLPGLRLEAFAREINSSAGRQSEDDARLFPTLHIRRAISNQIDLDLSYSSRILRPGLAMLNPTINYSEARRAFIGNPDLDPTTTDAYEINFIYQNRGRTYSLTAYDRVSENIISPLTETVGDVTYSTVVNAGRSEERGVQVVLRGPVKQNWRYSLSANALNREFDVLRGGSIRGESAFEYSGSAQIEYRDRDQSAPNADQVQLELRFQGPRHTLQSESEAFVVANLTWRRSLTTRLAAVLAVEDIFDSADSETIVSANDYYEWSRTSGRGTIARATLTYRFGSNAEHAGDQNPPPPPALPE